MTRRVLFDSVATPGKPPPVPPRIVGNDQSPHVTRKPTLGLVAAIAFASFAPAPFNIPTVPVSPVGGIVDFPEVIQTPVLPQQFTYFQPQGDIATYILLGGITDFPEVIKLPFLATQFTELPLQAPVSVVSVSFVDIQLSYVTIKPLQAARQQYSTSVTAQFATPQGGYQQPWQIRFAKPLPVRLEQFSPFVKQRFVSVSGYVSFPDAIQKRTKTTIHQFASFHPQGGKTTPSGWFAALAKVTKAPTLLHQFAYYQPQGDTGVVSNTTTSGYFGYQFDYTFAKALRAAIQQFAYFQPQGSISTSVTSPIGGFIDFPEIVQTPILPQQFAYFQPRGNVAIAATPYGWAVNFLNIIKKPILPQQFAYFQPQGTIISVVSTGQGWLSSNFRLAARVPRFAGQFDSLIQFAPNTTTSGYFGYQFDYTFVKALKAALQQFASLQPREIITVTPGAPFGGVVDFPEIVQTSVLPQQFTYFQPLGTVVVPSNTVPNGWLTTGFKLAARIPRFAGQFDSLIQLAPETPEGWRGYQFNYAFIKALSPARQQFNTFTKEQVAPDNTTTKGYFGYQFDYRFMKPVKAAIQQFAYFQPQGTITVVTGTPVGGFVDFPEIVQRPVVPQQFAYFQPQGTITTIVAAGQGWLSSNFKLAARIPRFAGQFDSLIQLAPNTTTSGYFGYQLDYAFAKALKASQQQFGSFQLFLKVAPSTAFGGWVDFPEIVQTSVLPQQFNPYPYFNAGNNIAVAHPGWEGIQLSAVFKKPYPVTLQQFNYFTPAGHIISVEQTHTRFFISNVGLLMGIR